jgi:hypothetical protein
MADGHLRKNTQKKKRKKTPGFWHKMMDDFGN